LAALTHGVRCCTGSDSALILIRQKEKHQQVCVSATARFIDRADMNWVVMVAHGSNSPI
jgi:hypothetical protein